MRNHLFRSYANLLSVRTSFPRDGLRARAAEFRAASRPALRRLAAIVATWLALLVRGARALAGRLASAVRHLAARVRALAGHRLVTRGRALLDRRVAEPGRILVGRPAVVAGRRAVVAGRRLSAPARALLARGRAALERHPAGRRLTAAARRLAALDRLLFDTLFGPPPAPGTSPDRADNSARPAGAAAGPASSAAGRYREEFMRMSRTRKVALFGVVVLALGLAGRASAGTRPPEGVVAAVPAAAAPAATRPAVKPRPKPAAGARTRPAGHSRSRTAGPAGSRTTTGGKGVALTFDDGPDPAQTPRLLKLLAQQHVRATFCLVGENVARHPDLVRKIVAGGHTLCNHTWNHSLKIGKQPATKIQADLQRTNAAIQRAAPGAKIKYFRAPGGNFTPRLVGVAKQMRMTSIYWKVDPRDWDHPEGETSSAHRRHLIARIEQHTHAGAIVLSHDYAQPDTIAAYRVLLPRLRHRYQLIALP